MSNRLTPQQKQQIIEFYSQGITPTKIGEMFNIYANSVNRIIRQNGGKSNQAKKKTSQEKVEAIIERYTKGESSEKIAKELNLNGTTICRILKRNNIEIRPASKNKRVYKINENFFESIDSFDKAYFLGFLFSDGNISKDKNNIKIELKRNDEDILRKLSILIYGFESIHYYKNNECLTACLLVSSQKMKQDLIKLGCGPNKTFTIRYPKIEEKYDSHFIRGYFDGDGCISITKENNAVVDITSNINFINDLVERLKYHTGIESRTYIYAKNDQVGCLQFKRKEYIEKMFEFLYKDNNNLFLERKYNKFVKYLNVINTTNKEPTNDIIKYWFDHFREHEFPYPQFTDNSLIENWQKLCNLETSLGSSTIISSFKPAGLKLTKHFFPQLYSVKNNNKPSMIEAFNNDNTLVAVIKNRIEQGYQLSNNMLIQGLRNGFFAFHTSIFYPSVAKIIYDKYCKTNDVVFDYSMGFGQRMLGALSLNKNLTYIACDPWKENIESADKMLNLLEICNSGIKSRVKLFDIGSEHYCDDKINLAFSSPPYFNKEIYTEETTQAYNRGYEYFIEWWNKVCKNIYKMLNNDGYFILNMAEQVNDINILSDMLSICHNNRFVEIERLFIQLSRNEKYRHRNKIKMEPVIVMKKF